VSIITIIQVCLSFYRKKEMVTI